MKLLDSLKNFFTTTKRNNYASFPVPLSGSNTSSLLNTLTTQEFMSFGLLTRAIQLVANDIAKVGYRHLKNGIDVPNSNIIKLLNKPSKTLTVWEFKKVIVWNLFIYGSAPILKQYDEFGQLNELVPIQPNFLKNKDNNYQIVDVNMFSFDVPASDIILLNYEMIQGFSEISFVSLFKSTINKVKENELSLINAIKNDFSYSLFLKVPEYGDRNQKQEAAQMLRQMLEVQKRDGVAALAIDNRWEVIRAGDMNISRIDFNTKTAIAKEFASMLGIPPQKLGIDDSNKYNSFDALNKSYIDNSLIPLLMNITQKLSQALITEQDEVLTYKMIDLVSMDTQALKEFVSSGINNGFITINEARNWIGLQKVELGDNILINGTLTALKHQLQTKEQEIKNVNKVK